MKFRGHETFFIRKGWLSKGLRKVQEHPDVFISREVNPMDAFGIGANMVKSLRYWLQAVGLTEEPQAGRRIQALTDLGNIILEHDPYMEELGTLWLLHYRLAANEENATAWHHFFNEFNITEFSRDDFFTKIKSLLRIREEEVSERSIEDDYNCIINTYVPRIKSNPEKVQPESNIDCPFGELGLVDIVNKKAKKYKKSVPKKNTLHPLILLAVILDQAQGTDRIRITDIQNSPKNAGKVFNLDIITLLSLLYQIEHLGFIKVVRTAGLDVIELKTRMGFIDCIREYYRMINNG